MDGHKSKANQRKNLKDKATRERFKVAGQRISALQATSH